MVFHARVNHRFGVVLREFVCVWCSVLNFKVEKFYRACYVIAYPQWNYYHSHLITESNHVEQN